MNLGLNKKMARKYKELFLGSDLGEEVLQDLLSNRCKMRANPHCLGDAQGTGINIGKQEVGRSIASLLTLDELQLMKFSQIPDNILNDMKEGQF